MYKKSFLIVLKVRFYREELLEQFNGFLVIRLMVKKCMPSNLNILHWITRWKLLHLWKQFLLRAEIGAASNGINSVIDIKNFKSTYF